MKRIDNIFFNLNQHAMKNLTLKALAFAGAMMMGAASMAQPAQADFSLISAQASTTYVTLDKSVPVYATPDPIYHPTWAFPSTNLTAGFTWVFTSANFGTEITLNQAVALPNYVTITGNTVGGPYAVNVKETAPAAFGGCSDAGLNFNVVVTGKPTAAMTGGLVAAWIVDPVTATGTTAHICGDVAAGENLTVAFTEAGAPAAFASYAYLVQKRVVNIDVAGVEIAPAPVVTSISDRTTAAKFAPGAGMVETIATGALSTINSKRTKYTFTISKASNLPALTADGIVSAISHKSDYVLANAAGIPAVASVTTYPFTAGSTTVEYIVNPTPVTGPVYHISNSFAF